jgi:hypothetical protein
MRTITLDILDDKAINLLKDLETLNVIKLHAVKEDKKIEAINSIKKLQGLMSKQSLEEIDRQLFDLRNEWD